MSERVYCCEANAGEPMLGTSDVVDLWLLLEYRPVWKAKAVTDNGLSESVGNWLREGIAALQAAGLKVRPQLIRQPEIDRSDTRMLVHHQGVLRELGTGRVGYDHLIETPLETLVRNASFGTVLDAPRYFVCTNGQRDLCCARFGPPRFQALQKPRRWRQQPLN